MPNSDAKRAEAAANPTRMNIEAIANMEHEALHRRTFTERVSDSVVKFIGSVGFLLLQVLLVLTWSAINLNLVWFVKPFDPFPFGILALTISSESVVLTSTPAPPACPPANPDASAAPPAGSCDSG